MRNIYEEMTPILEMVYNVYKAKTIKVEVSRITYNEWFRTIKEKSPNFDFSEKFILGTSRVAIQLVENEDEILKISIIEC